MSVFKKDNLEKRVEKLEKQVKSILQSIGKSEKPEEEVEDEDEYCCISWHHATISALILSSGL